MTITPSPSERVTLIGIAVEQAADALAYWSRRQDRGEITYVEAGHRALTKIDASIMLLHQARQALIADLRADEDARAQRIDAMLHLDTEEES